jgi:hypothetical protein
MLFVVLLAGILGIVLVWLYPSNRGTFDFIEWKGMYIMPVLVIVLILLAAKYKIFVDRHGIKTFMSFFNFTEHIPLANIATVEIVRYGSDNKNKWTVSMFIKQGVIIKTKSGEEHIIESNTPEKLKEAICSFLEKYVPNV